MVNKERCLRFALDLLQRLWWEHSWTKGKFYEEDFLPERIYCRIQRCAGIERHCRIYNVYDKISMQTEVCRERYKETGMLRKSYTETNIHTERGIECIYCSRRLTGERGIRVL